MERKNEGHGIRSGALIPRRFHLREGQVSLFLSYSNQRVCLHSLVCGCVCQCGFVYKFRCFITFSLEQLADCLQKR